MVKHIVMFRFQGDGDEKIENIALFKDKLDSLKSKIKELKQLETGVNYSASPSAADLVLVTEFADDEALEAYKAHPDHQAILPMLKELTLEVRVVDYSF